MIKEIHACNEMNLVVMYMRSLGQILHLPKAPKAPKAKKRNQAKPQSATSEQ